MFSTEHINKRLTFSVFIISEWRKTKKFNRAFNQYQDYFFDLKLKIQMHHIKNFIYSHLLSLKQQTWECKRKCILCQFWNTLAEYFWDIRSKVESFVKHLLLHQNYVWMDYPPIFRSTPLTHTHTLCVTCLLILIFSQPSFIQ